MRHEEFAEQAGRRLESMADRLEREAKTLGIDGGEASKTTARAQEMRVAARLVREEAVAASRKERESPGEKLAENLSLETQG